MRAPLNTTRMMNQNPFGFLAEAMTHGTGSAIEEQEANGQRQFVGSDTLPSEISENNKALLEKAGFKFLGPVEGDALFQYVEMPAGWTKARTDHSMWSELRDAKGRRRGGIFYKATFYDRAAHMSLDRRYSVRMDYDRADKAHEAVAQVMDGDTVIHSSDSFALPENRDRVYYDISDRAKEEATAWLATQFPDWQNTAAYWD